MHLVFEFAFYNLLKILELAPRCNCNPLYAPLIRKVTTH